MTPSDDIVITGLGVCCNLGDDLLAITKCLKNGVGKPFSRFEPADRWGGRCRIIGPYEGDVSNDALGISKAQSRFLGRSSKLALKAARAAISQSGCDTRESAVIVGSGTGDVDTHREVASKLESGAGMRRVSPAVVPKIMSSTVSANLATLLGAKGPSCSVTAACAGGAYNIVMAALLLRAGAAELAIAGGVDSKDPHFFAGFDSMGAYNREDNDHPERASRPYAADRKGFIFGEGAGIVVLETRARAEARGAAVLARLQGFGMSSDGTGQMVQPATEGGLRAMRAALANAQLHASRVDYVNTHATSTPLGDVSEVNAMREVFDGRKVPYSSTKGYTGHSVSGAGAVEAIFTVQMMREGFLAPCIHAEPLDPELVDYPPVLVPTERAIEVALSNSFGFGGTNVTLVLSAS